MFGFALLSHFDGVLKSLQSCNTISLNELTPAGGLKHGFKKKSSGQIQNKWTQLKNNLRTGCIQKQHQSSALLYTPEKSVVMAFGHQSKTLVHVTPKTFILNPASLQHEQDRKEMAGNSCQHSGEMLMTLGVITNARLSQTPVLATLLWKWIALKRRVMLVMKHVMMW